MGGTTILCDTNPLPSLMLDNLTHVSATIVDESLDSGDLPGAAVRGRDSDLAVVHPLVIEPLLP